MNLKQALLIGVGQMFAIIPGFSRSGTTMTAARVMKLDRESAARFSFLLGAPAILGATILSVKDILTSSRMIELSNMLQKDKFDNYGLDESLRNAFKSLCVTFDTFKTWTLSSIEKKVEYDMSLGLVRTPVGQPTKKL